MTATGIRMTAEELLRLPDTGIRYELIAGDLHEMAPAGGEHGLVSGRVTRRVGSFIDRHAELGGEIFSSDTGYRLSREPDTVRAPDLSYVAPERVAQARVRGYPEMAPDLVVEVVSPNDTASDIQTKVDEWLQAGSQLVWVIYPATRSAMVFQPGGAAQVLHAEDSLTGGAVLPGFACRLADLF